VALRLHRRRGPRTHSPNQLLAATRPPLSPHCPPQSLLILPLHSLPPLSPLDTTNRPPSCSLAALLLSSASNTGNLARTLPLLNRPSEPNRTHTHARALHSSASELGFDAGNPAMSRRVAELERELESKRKTQADLECEWGRVCVWGLLLI
jgi:hypothetical protein